MIPVELQRGPWRAGVLEFCRERKSFGEVYGYELRDGLVAQLRASAVARKETIDDIRNAWWSIRNHRGCCDARVYGAVGHILEAHELLQLAGVPQVILERVTFCLSECLGHGSRACSEGRCPVVDGVELATLRISPVVCDS